MPDRCPLDAILNSVARLEETAGSAATARYAIATGAPASAVSKSRPHTNSPAAARIGRTPDTRPTRQPRPQNAEESAWQRAARLEKEEMRQEKRLKGRAVLPGGPQSEPGHPTFFSAS